MKENFPKPQEEEPEGGSRRDFLRLTALGAIGLTVTASGIECVDSETDKEKNNLDQRLEKMPDIGQEFLKEQKLYQTLYGQLTTNQIIFYKDDKELLGGPLELEPTEVILGDGTKKIIDPGPRNAKGIIKGKISQEWLDVKRKKISTEFGVGHDAGLGLPKVTSTIKVVRDAIDADPELSAKTLLDVVEHYGNQVVVDSKLTRLEYLRENFGKLDLMPVSIASELAAHVAGIGAQESNYNNAAVSSVGALGVFQFMPDTWKSLGYKKEDIKSFIKQVEGVEKHFALTYSQFIKNEETSKTLDQIKNNFFDGDQDSFDKYFVVPIVVNSYNSGTSRVANVVNLFSKSFPTKESFEKKFGEKQQQLGYDLYAVMARNTAAEESITGYRKHSSEYFSRVHAMAKILKK